MKKIFIVLILTAIPLYAQTPVVLQTWMEVEGDTNMQQLGLDVGYLGKKGDTTIISVTEANDVIKVYYITNPDDTIPRYTLKGYGCSSGDFNGDGIQDLLVNGNPTKIYLATSPGVFDTIPYFVKHKELAGYYFGYRVATGKINEDNFYDLVIADVAYPNFNFTGRVYIYWGGVIMDTIPNYILNGDSIRVGFGDNIALGDLNNDGFDDIIVRGYDSNHPINRFSYIKIFWGSNSIDSTTWQYIRGTNSNADIASFDINGDSIDDLLWSNIDSLSTVYIHYGGFDLDSIPNLKLDNPGIGGLGDVVVNGGDLNGDGYNDIVSGAPGHAQGLGFVLVYSGGPLIDGNFDAAVGLSVQSQFGQSIVSVIDISGDGLDDILVGAPRFKWDDWWGKWFIFLGDSSIPVTSVEKEDFIQPKYIDLHQNFPNPFNPVTVIKWQTSVWGHNAVKVFDILGKEITVLVNEEKPSGEYEIEFDASRYNLSSGVYFYKLTLTDSKGNKHTQTKSMVLIK